MKIQNLFFKAAFLLLVLLTPITLFAQSLSPGMWRGVLMLRDSVELPFTFKVSTIDSKTRIEIRNAKEVILIEDVTFRADSVFMRFPVYETEIAAKISKNKLEGTFTNFTRKAKGVIAFEATFGLDYRFKKMFLSPSAFVFGKWETTFSPGTKDSSKAIAVFKNQGNLLSGTFLTPTGDYRYLEGYTEGDSIQLSTFDGTFVYLFKAKVSGEKMHGIFYSGSHWKEEWTAVRNPSFNLPDPNSMTYMKEGYDRFEFSFPNLDSVLVSVNDPSMQGKVRVIQIMGTWCPNCLDETAFLSDYYNRNKNPKLEFIALGFEKTTEFQKAKSNLVRFQKKYQVKYPILVAGQSNRIEAGKSLPMLNEIISFPTTIYLDKKGSVRKIYTGFNGPATGSEYQKFIDEFHSLIEKLLAE